MAGLIPKSFIHDLLQRVDIVDVIDARVPLKKAGRDHKACCPFHQEKTASFTVSAEKQFYHCFGCGAHGNALDFLMEFDRLGFVEAVEDLAQSVNLPVPREESAAIPPPPEKGLYELLDQAAAYYRRALREHPAAPEAVSYLKGRGLTGDIAARFEMGFAPPGWDNLIRQLGTGATAREALLKLGLVVRNDQGREYDRFRNRAMFPIRDRRGRIVGFGGRALDDDGPKYMNSPESPVFHKGRELYGLYEALQHKGRPEHLLVVEGYMDVVALTQHGIDGAVGTLGTATTREHLEALYRCTSHLVFCFDGDRAGRQAAWRALENTLPTLRDGRQAHFLFLPEGEDPDSLVRNEGQTAFRKRLSEALALSEFLFRTLQEQTNVATLDGRARFVDLARPLLNTVPGGALHQLLINQTAQIAGLRPEQLTKLLDNPTSSVKQPDSSHRKGSSTPSAVRSAISALLHRPSLGERVVNPPSWQELQLPGVKLLADLLELTKVQPHITTGGILEHWRGSEEGKHLAKLASSEPHLDNSGLEKEFLDALERLNELVRRESDISTRAFSPSELSDSQKHGLRRQFRVRALKDKLKARSISDEEFEELHKLLAEEADS
ncbi:MAG: DNA primase [Proteobacteria bacterium]|nr:MAG: DNA primase [Pseudomonadota bacterium]QKK12576.1 MAG: DNA primase [Pseudomonadota bacterium]